MSPSPVYKSSCPLIRQWGGWAGESTFEPFACLRNKANFPFHHPCLLAFEQWTVSLENPMDGGDWKTAVRGGVAEGRTGLSDFTFTFHFHALEKEMATHSSVPVWRIPGTVEPGRLPSMGSHRVGHDWSDLAAAAAASIWTTCRKVCAHNARPHSRYIWLPWFSGVPPLPWHCVGKALRNLLLVACWPWEGAWGDILAAAEAICFEDPPCFSPARHWLPTYFPLEEWKPESGRTEALQDPVSPLVCTRLTSLLSMMRSLGILSVSSDVCLPLGTV